MTRLLWKNSITTYLGLGPFFNARVPVIPGELEVSCHWAGPCQALFVDNTGPVKPAHGQCKHGEWRTKIPGEAWWRSLEWILFEPPRAELNWTEQQVGEELFRPFSFPTSHNEITKGLGLCTMMVKTHFSRGSTNIRTVNQKTPLFIDRDRGARICAIMIIMHEFCLDLALKKSQSLQKTK